jgi:hypothetical protein
MLEAGSRKRVAPPLQVEVAGAVSAPENFVRIERYETEIINADICYSADQTV